MVITLSEGASKAMLATLGRLMDGGQLELLSGEAKVLAVMRLSDTAARITNEELVFNEIAATQARAEGRAEIGRVVGADGAEIFSCDVSTESGDGAIKLNGTRLYLNGAVHIRSFKLTMP